MNVHVRPQREAMRPRGWYDRHGMVPRRSSGVRARQPRTDAYKQHRR